MLFRSADLGPYSAPSMVCFLYPSTLAWQGRGHRDTHPPPNGEGLTPCEANTCDWRHFRAQNSLGLKSTLWGAWVAQSVERPTSAQVMISKSMSSSPVLGSVLTARSLEPVSNSVSPSLSLLPCSHSFSLSSQK